MTLPEVVQIFEEYRTLHRNDRDGGYALIFDIVKIRDWMSEAERETFDDVLVELIMTNPDLRSDALWLLNIAVDRSRYGVKEVVFTKVAEWLRTSPPEIGEHERLEVIRLLLWSRYRQAVDLYAELLSWEEKNDPAGSLHTLAWLCVLIEDASYKESLAQKLCWYVGEQSPNLHYILSLFYIIFHNGSPEICEDILRLARQTCQSSEYRLLLSYLLQEVTRWLSGNFVFGEDKDRLERFISLLRALQHDDEGNGKQNNDTESCG